MPSKHDEHRLFILQMCEEILMQCDTVAVKSCSRHMHGEGARCLALKSILPRVKRGAKKGERASYLEEA